VFNRSPPGSRLSRVVVSCIRPRSRPRPIGVEATKSVASLDTWKWGKCHGCQAACHWSDWPTHNTPLYNIWIVKLLSEPEYNQPTTFAKANTVTLLRNSNYHYLKHLLPISSACKFLLRLTTSLHRQSPIHANSKIADLLPKPICITCKFTHPVFVGPCILNNEPRKCGITFTLAVFSYAYNAPNSFSTEVPPPRWWAHDTQRDSVVV